MRACVYTPGTFTLSSALLAIHEKRRSLERIIKAFHEFYQTTERNENLVGQSTVRYTIVFTIDISLSLFLFMRMSTNGINRNKIIDSVRKTFSSFGTDVDESCRLEHLKGRDAKISER